jgi:hypothetical protein
VPASGRTDASGETKDEPAETTDALVVTRAGQAASMMAEMATQPTGAMVAARTDEKRVARQVAREAAKTSEPEAGAAASPQPGATGGGEAAAAAPPLAGAVSR